MKQLFIMLVGFSKSGKTTLAKKIQQRFYQRFVRINSDSIHRLLDETYQIFLDDKTIYGKNFALRQKVTMAVQKALVEALVPAGYSIILECCNLEPGKRKTVLTKVKKLNKNVITVIIRLLLPEKELYENLRKADQQNLTRGEKPTWIDLYEKIQKVKFVPPQKTEADYLLSYQSKKSSIFFAKLEKIVNQ